VRTLVAGIGNIFNRDDGFGVEVAQRLVAAGMPDDVHVEDYGIRGVHLAIELLEGYDLLVLIDAIAGEDEPGTITVLEPDAATIGNDSGPLDAHSMNPQAVLHMVGEMGGRIGRVLVVGCQPDAVDEGIGLSADVAAAVEPAVRIVQDLVAERTSPCVVS